MPEIVLHAYYWTLASPPPKLAPMTPLAQLIHIAQNITH